MITFLVAPALKQAVSVESRADCHHKASAHRQETSPHGTVV